jgi:hypothetical protein
MIARKGKGSLCHVETGDFLHQHLSISYQAAALQIPLPVARVLSLVLPSLIEDCEYLMIWLR